MMPIAVLAVFLLLAAVGYWLTARRRAPKQVRRKQPAAPQFGAVEIRARAAACEAARALQGRRYLSSEAPALPLAACTATACSCAFVKLSDRRTDERRLEHASLSASMFLAENRRRRSGRREED